MGNVDRNEASIPLVDLHAQYLAIKPEMDAAIERVLARSAFISGEEVQSFADEFAAYCATDDAPAAGPPRRLSCATCGNGTDALYLALRALGVGAGHEVITVAHTFIATAEAITLTGARPVFVDVREDTMLIDPDQVEKAVTPRTRAIIPVDLYGQPCDMDKIVEIARSHNLRVVEDAVQWHGAFWQGRRVGSFGDAACFSFFPAKNLGACGDGGAVVSQDEDLIRQVRRLANHGRLEKYTHEIEGINSRLDGIQAAILRVKLQYLDRWNAARRKVAALYMRRLGETDAVSPTVHPGADPVWHLFVVRLPERERVQSELKKRGIATGVHYPIPLHFQPAYRYLGVPAGTLPVTEKVASQILSLPIYPELKADDIDFISTALAVICPGRKDSLQREPAGVAECIS